MIEVFCPTCEKTRQVKIWKKSWGTDHVRQCPSCSKVGRTMSESSKAKISEALAGMKKPPEFSERLKARHEVDPSLKEHLIAGAGAGHNKGISTGPHSKKTKKKISKSMKLHWQQNAT